jgi:hypothetical protein
MLAKGICGINVSSFDANLKSITLSFNHEKECDAIV